MPAHPSRIGFEPRPFSVPRAEPLVHRLSNGTPVVIVEDRSLPLVDVTVALLAGSYLDPPERPGLAELTAAMLRRGGAGGRSPDAFDDAVDRLGAEIDSRATTTRGGASLDSLAETFEASLALFFDMLRAPAFDASRLAGIETNLLAGFRARNDDPLAVMEREWSWLLFGDRHYLGRQLVAADLEAITPNDLVRFHARYWRPERVVLAVSGDMRTDHVLTLLEAEVTRWRAALPAAEGPPAAWPPAAASSEAERGLYVAEHPSPQAKVSIGHALPPIDDWLSREAAALEVANEILGGTRGQISRINGRLRGRGWVYRALSELDPGRFFEGGRFEPGSFRIFLDASPENTVAAIDACLDEIDRMRTTDVPIRDLDTVRGELVSALALRFDTPVEVAGYFAEDLLLGRPHEYWYTYAERLLSLTPADLRRATAAALDPERLKALVVGGGAPSLATPAASALATRLGGRHTLPARDPLTLTTSRK